LGSRNITTMLIPLY